MEYIISLVDHIYFLNMKYKFFIYILLALLFYSCSPPKSYVGVEGMSSGKTAPYKKNNSYIINGERYYPITNSDGFIQIGLASWYGGEFHGRKTSNGELYDMHQKSAAHKILPFNTYVKVINQTNNKYTIVRINDRGPFIKGRIIDLSYAAAKEIDLVGKGVAQVKIIALKSEQIDPEIQEGLFTIQIGAFSDRANAQRLADRLRVLYEYVNISEYTDDNNNIFYRLHVSKTHNLNSAIKAEKKLEDMGFIEAFIVRL